MLSQLCAGVCKDLGFVLLFLPMWFNSNHLTIFRTQNVLGEKGRRIRELTAVVQKRFGFPEGSVEVGNQEIRLRSVLSSLSDVF